VDDALGVLEAMAAAWRDGEPPQFGSGG